MKECINYYLEKGNPDTNTKLILHIPISNIGTWIEIQCNMVDSFSIDRSKLQFYKQYKCRNSVIRIDSKNLKKKAFIEYNLFSYKSENYTATLVKNLQQPHNNPWTSFPFHFDEECECQRNTYIVQNEMIQIHFIRKIHTKSLRTEFFAEIHMNPSKLYNNDDKIDNKIIEFIEFIEFIE